MEQTDHIEPDPKAHYFHLAGAPLAVGSVILPGNWGRIIKRTGWQHGQALRELALEGARIDRFPTRPSRFECAFAFVEEREAQWFRQAVDGFQNHNLFRVGLQDSEALSFVANAQNLPPLVPFDPRWPDQYWMGVPTNTDSGAPIERSVCDGGTFCTELLTLSPLVVQELID